MRQIVSAACGLWLCAAQGALAQEAAGPVVVELYTSQGCSSCPPADALLAELADQPGVIPLALHVDYWDYIGWADQFAQPGFTKRQKAYAKAVGERMIYTPQMIVGGVDRVVGHEPEAVAEAIARAAQVRSPVRLTVTRVGRQLVIRAVAIPPLDAPAMVQLVGYRPGATVEISHGENAGLAVEYRNIVTSWERLGDWSGQEPLELAAPAPGDGPGVVIVQRQGPAEILAAARID
ncbi:DUF1223 domain-containing protein [Tabrizicola oligotrophica]|uniref:DUF1223 domain-containing protein n=1 Tax=Tabrizicola oligotrophica TaxID=2710650 RepID=A0A6M0QPA3_9RHOB|nr:DUF1223 domain-containing protein [Tabrizicola oligotrophica]